MLKSVKITRHDAGTTYPLVHQADTLCAGDFVFTSGMMADDGKQGLAEEARPKPGYPYFESEIKLQTRVILTKVQQALAKAGLDLSHVVKAHGFLMDPADFCPMDEVWGEFFPHKISRTFVKAASLPVPGARFSLDVIACRPDSGLEIVRGNAGEAPSFSHKVEATRVGDLIFTSGQLGYDSRAGFPPEARRDRTDPSAGPDVVRQSAFTIKNLTKSIEAVGGSAGHMAKAVVYLTESENHPAFKQHWRNAFDVHPSDMIVQQGLFVPEGLLEVDLTGYVNRPGVDAGPIGEPSERRGFKVGGMVFASGRAAVDADGLVPLQATVHPAFPNYGVDIKLQTRYVLDELKETLAMAGSGLSRVCRANVFLKDLRHYVAMNDVWREYFPEPPARTVIGADWVGGKDALIAIDLMAVAE